MKFLKQFKLFEGGSAHSELDLNFCNDLFLDISDEWSLMRVEKRPTF